MLPEMKGRSLEEIDQLFEKKVPTRQFDKYVCTTREQAHSVAVKKGNTEVSHVEGHEMTITGA